MHPAVDMKRFSLVLLIVLMTAMAIRHTNEPPMADARPDRIAVDGVSTTADNQILVELLPEDASEANPFDLDGLTLVFTPDGRGGYARNVRGLVWERDIGTAVADGTMIALESFGFDFAGQRWTSFHVSQHGLVTFGGPFTYSYWDFANRFSTMHEIADKFVDTPTISALYKPILGGRSDNRRYGATQHVARRPDRVVVTWITTEPDYYVQGVPPYKPARFQVVLNADGGIRFNYADVALGDGIVGLFPDDEVVKGDLIASVVDGTNPELPGHLDLLEVAVYESNTDAVIVEFTTRTPIPDPGEGTVYSFRLYVDADRPWWTTPIDFSDMDFVWQIDVHSGGDHRARGDDVKGLLASDAENRIALLADIGDFQGISTTVVADAAEFDDGHFVQNNISSPTLIELPTRTMVDLSQSDDRFTNRHSEVFHYRQQPDLTEITCRVIDVLGDVFDLFVFCNEFRTDSQESASPWRSYVSNTEVRGVGELFREVAPCGEGRLKGRWDRPVWMESNHVFDASPGRRENERFDRGLLLFAHEFTHFWTAHASFINRNGEREPLYGNYCQCHWRWDIQLPAAFPWHAEHPGHGSLMGDGRHWRDNADGTFTPVYRYHSGGHSWLDLYLMGLADAHEVPDMFILRNLRELGGNRWRGDQEIVSINQVIAAEGPREPRAARAQRVFNAGFVYLLEPGQDPSGDLLDLHRRYRDKVQEHWVHITGGRSRITTILHE